MVPGWRVYIICGGMARKKDAKGLERCGIFRQPMWYGKEQAKGVWEVGFKSTLLGTLWAKGKGEDDG